MPDKMETPWFQRRRRHSSVAMASVALLLLSGCASKLRLVDAPPCGTQANINPTCWTRLEVDDRTAFDQVCQEIVQSAKATCAQHGMNLQIKEGSYLRERTCDCYLEPMWSGPPTPHCDIDYRCK